jgi:hypothetical protein
MNTPATVLVVLAPERLATLTKEINEALGEVRKACRISLEAALRAGKALAEIKAALPYGAYLLPFERPKLAAVISTNLSEQAFGEALEKARKRMDGPQTPLLKAPAQPTDLSAKPMVSDRRFRK